MIDPDGRTTTYTYDTYGDVATVQDPLGNTQSSSYNSVGWRTSSVSPKGNVSGCNCAAQYTTAYSYLDPSNGSTNQFGDVRTTTDPLGHTVVKGYDANRQVTSMKDGDGKTTGYKYDAVGEQTDVQRLDGTTLHTDYNSDGTVKDQVDGAGKMTAYGYDPVARVSSVTDPLLRATLVTYDGAGNRLTLKDPQLQTTTFGYDADNEVTGITYSDGVTPNVSNLTHDGNGQRKTMTDATGTSSWNYDSLNRMTSSSDGAGHTVGYGYRLGTGYELKSQITGITYPNGSAVTNGYDAAGHLQTVQDWLGHTTTFGYDPNSGYVAGNPMNGADPSGLAPWDDICFRNPFGGHNDNGSCHTTLSTSQGVKALAVTGG